MGKGKYDKVFCRLDAIIVSAGITYKGCVEEIIKQGPEYYLVMSVISPPKEFVPDKTVRLNFLIASDAIRDLNCRSIWFMNDAQQLKTVIGMKVINPLQSCSDLISQYISANAVKVLKPPKRR